jgi:hypothetical protein
VNSGYDTAVRSKGLRYSAAAGNEFGIERVKSVARDAAHADLVHVELQFFPRDRTLPAQLENPSAVTATLDDVVGTRLPVRGLSVQGDTLTVAVAVPSGVKRFRLQIRGLIAGLDTVEVALLEGDPAFDPAAQPPPPREPSKPPVLVDYLAKDFQSFKRLMLDSISHQMPGFTERHEADVGIAIVEVLAFAADQLSYFQDAVATEAYLQTARRRVSVRRHARLVGYRLHEGCAPRVWVYARVTQAFDLEQGTAFGTAVDESVAQRIFEALETVSLHPSMNELQLWDNATDDFVVPKGATSADLACDSVADGGPDLSTLRAGTVLVFEQRCDALTGRKAPSRNRHAVRLARDAREWCRWEDGCRLIRIHWHAEDRLPFDLPVRTVTGAPATVVLGNLVPADYGLTQPLPDPPAVDSTWAIRTFIPDLTFAVPYEPAERYQPASRFTAIKPYKADAAIRVRASSLTATMEWHARRDLIGADPYDKAFAVELERDGLVVLRFGDGVNGWRPDPASQFAVTYRSGNGMAGHVGADAIRLVNAADARIESVRNPLPSSGGEDRLDAVRAKREAAEKIRDQKRCIADEDYLRVARSVPGVNAASVEHRWTGSGPMVDVYVDADGNAPKKRDEVMAALEAQRLIGVAVTVRSPRRVGVVIALRVRHAPSANASEIAQRVAAEGHAALQAQELTLGKRLFASWLLDAAMKVSGVVDVTLHAFHRQDGEDRRAQGFIAFGKTEVPVLVDFDGIATGGRPLVEVQRP